MALSDKSKKVLGACCMISAVEIFALAPNAPEVVVAIVVTFVLGAIFGWLIPDRYF